MDGIFKMYVCVSHFNHYHTQWNLKVCELFRTVYISV